MATHSSIFAWRIPWIDKPGGLQSLGLQKSWIWHKVTQCPLTLDQGSCLPSDGRSHHFCHYNCPCLASWLVWRQLCRSSCGPHTLPSLSFSLMIQEGTPILQHRAGRKPTSSMGSMSWATTTSWAFLLSSKVGTVSKPAQKIGGS